MEENLKKMERELNLLEQAKEKMNIINEMFTQQTFMTTCFTIATGLKLNGDEFQSMVASNDFKLEIKVALEINKHKAIEIQKMSGTFTQEETEYDRSIRNYIG